VHYSASRGKKTAINSDTQHAGIYGESYRGSRQCYKRDLTTVTDASFPAATPIRINIPSTEASVEVDILLLLRPGRGAKYCDVYVCLIVSLSV